MEWQPIETAPKDGTWISMLMDGPACTQTVGARNFIVNMKFQGRWICKEDKWPEDRMLGWRPSNGHL